MPRNVIATLTIGEGDPPGVLLHILADGQELAKPTVLAPDATMTLADALTQVTGQSDVQAVMRGLVEPVVAQLEALVMQGASRQQEYEQALAAWQQALGPPPPPATP